MIWATTPGIGLRLSTVNVPAAPSDGTPGPSTEPEVHSWHSETVQVGGFDTVAQHGLLEMQPWQSVMVTQYTPGPLAFNTHAPPVGIGMLSFVHAHEYGAQPPTAVAVSTALGSQLFDGLTVQAGGMHAVSVPVQGTALVLGSLIIFKRRYQC